MRPLYPVIYYDSLKKRSSDSSFWTFNWLRLERNSSDLTRESILSGYWVRIGMSVRIRQILGVVNSSPVR